MRWLCYFNSNSVAEFYLQMQRLNLVAYFVLKQRLWLITGGIGSQSLWEWRWFLRWLNLRCCVGSWQAKSLAWASMLAIISIHDRWASSLHRAVVILIWHKHWWWPSELCRSQIGLAIAYQGRGLWIVIWNQLCQLIQMGLRILLIWSLNLALAWFIL